MILDSGTDIWQITKTQGTRFVKANPSFKPKWSDGRRSITAKIGQLTNDDATIIRVVSISISILIIHSLPTHSPPN